MCVCVVFFLQFLVLSNRGDDRKRYDICSYAQPQEYLSYCNINSSFCSGICAWISVFCVTASLWDEQLALRKFWNTSCCCCWVAFRWRSTSKHKFVVKCPYDNDNPAFVVKWLKIPENKKKQVEKKKKIVIGSTAPQNILWCGAHRSVCTEHQRIYATRCLGAVAIDTQDQSERQLIIQAIPLVLRRSALLCGQGKLLFKIWCTRQDAECYCCKQLS